MSETDYTPETDEDRRRRLLTRALTHVAFDGWTRAAMSRAAEDEGLPEMEVRRLYPKGPASLIDQFYVFMDEQTVTVLGGLDLEAMKIRQRIATCVKVRLTIYDRHREAVRRLVTVMSMPEFGIKRHVHASLFRTADMMWRAAGDTSTDFNYYTKRWLLMAVYASTLLHWLDDDSEDYERTWEFLDRRITDVMQIQKFKGRLSSIQGLLPSSFPVAALEFVPDRLPGLIPFPIRKPIELVGRWAKRRAKKEAQTDRQEASMQQGPA